MMLFSWRPANSPIKRADAIDFQNRVIVPTLKELNLYSDAAAVLLLGTALVESRLVHRTQLGAGPARGYYQMEMFTHDSLWRDYLNYRQQLAYAIQRLRTSASTAESDLTYHDPYATAMARIKYLPVAESLPRPEDVDGMAYYWKRYYNTPLGRGTVDKYVGTWRMVMGSF